MTVEYPRQRSVLIFCNSLLITPPIGLWEAVSASLHSPPNSAIPTLASAPRTLITLSHSTATRTSIPVLQDIMLVDRWAASRSFESVLSNTFCHCWVVVEVSLMNHFWVRCLSMEFTFNYYRD